MIERQTGDVYGWPEGQKVLEFGITNKCNLYCPPCPRTGKDYDKISDLSYDDYEELLFTNHKEFKNQVVKFCGNFGDPLSHPEIEKFINLSNKIFDSVQINTNGSLRNARWFKRVFSNNEKLTFKFGLDGVDHETNIKYRINSNFDKVMTHIKTCAKIDSFRVYWDFTIFNFNKHQKEKAMQIAKELNIHLQLRENSTMWEYEKNNIEIKYEQKPIKKDNNPKNIHCRFYDYNAEEFLNLQVDAEMKLLPCCYMVIHSYQDSDFQMPFENDLHKISYDTAVKKINTYFNKKTWKETGAHKSCIQLCTKNSNDIGQNGPDY